MFLPNELNQIIVPPIKCQGIKTKLVKFIAGNIFWDGKGTWFEPFLGSGVVLFNICPENAIISDKNEHVINFYKQIQDKKIDSHIAREFLEYHGEQLKLNGEDYYYEMRKVFNETKDSLMFLFLNRSCFNGIIRFNKKGHFNVPFCKKNNRFQKAYITKICNQIKNISNCLNDKNWKFISSDWKDVVNTAKRGDFIYLDPPYIGRSTGYVDLWEENEEIYLEKFLNDTDAYFALSTWKENKYRKNDQIKKWGIYKSIDFEHFYHVGPSESLRNKIIESLILNC